VGCFVDLDGDVVVFAEAEGEAEAADSAADDGETEGAILFVVGWSRRADRRERIGFAYIGADVVVFRDGGHCCCLCGSTVGSSLILEFAEGSEADGRTMLAECCNAMMLRQWFGHVEVRIYPNIRFQLLPIIVVRTSN
jgi:hypothetical protein